MAPSTSVKFLIAVLAVIICSALTTDSASVQHHHHHSHQQRLVRSSDKATEEAVSHCSDNTPCGWAVYTRFTRVVDYFMKNTCTCDAGLECIRVDDDVSVSAYVYKCRTTSRSSSKGGEGATS